MAHDALGAHARDELGISEVSDRAPGAGGAGVGGDLRGRRRRCRCWSPPARTGDARGRRRVAATRWCSWPCSAPLAARAGGAPVVLGAVRVTFWGALAMALTAGVGGLFGTVA